MKTTILSIVLTMFYFTMFSGTSVSNDLTDYVLTDQGIVYVTDLRYGLKSYLVGKINKEEKVYFSKKEILSYRLNGKVFSKKKLIINGKECSECTFMEKLITRAGYTVYMHEKTINVNKKITEFFVYYAGKYELQINNKNLPVILSFFFPEFNKLYTV